MKNLQKGSVNVWLVAIIVALMIIVGYFAFIKNPTQVDKQTDSVPEVQNQAPVTTTQQQVDQQTDTSVNQPTPVPSITIISPNGGESLSQNTSYTLAWDYSGLSNSDSITIGFRTSNENVCWAGKTAASARSYSFVPSQIKCDGSILNLKSGGQFKVQLIVDKYANSRGVADTSDNYFTITTQ